MPSLSDTMMNCECLKCVRSITPMFWVWLRSRAASISSRMYMGAGLNSSSARMRERARSERCPPLSSERDSFQQSANPTLNSSPSRTVPPSGGSSLACAPGSSVEKMEPKSRFTFAHVVLRALFFLSSSSSMTCSILVLSFSMMRFFRTRSWYSASALSKSDWTFLLILRPSFVCSSSACSSLAIAASASPLEKSKSPWGLFR
mmetsp:Transcript_69897/g.164484  ORF Transcript_69897/g.164484 Transcript_69897/m.164484 type:complete len:203 (-) Transcript_69897:889-1497(-)